MSLWLNNVTNRRVLIECVKTNVKIGRVDCILFFHCSVYVLSS